MQERLSRAIEFTRSQEGTLLFLICALVAQTPHSATVFHRVATSESWWLWAWFHAYFFAIALEFAVLVFVVRGKARLSWAFASFGVLMNLVYSYDVAYWSLAWREALPVVAGALISSIILPLAIACYSHEVGESQPEKPTAQPETTEWKPDAATRGQQLLDEGMEKPEIAKQLRSEGYTGNQIATALSVNKSTVSRYLNGVQP